MEFSPLKTRRERKVKRHIEETSLVTAYNIGSRLISEGDGYGEFRARIGKSPKGIEASDFIDTIANNTLAVIKEMRVETPILYDRAASFYRSPELQGSLDSLITAYDRLGALTIVFVEKQSETMEAYLLPYLLGED